MIEKKVGNVTLSMGDDRRVAVKIGTVYALSVWHADEIPDFGPEVVAAIEDLRKPLAENECWGPDGCRLQFELCDADGVGIAVQNDDTVLVEGAGQALLKFESAYDALRIWAEKERGRWTLQRDDRRVLILRDGKIGFGVSNSLGTSTNNPAPAWVRTKAQAEYEAMVRERKPKKPSERLSVVFSGDQGTPYYKEVLSILDELAEKVGGL